MLTFLLWAILPVSNAFAAGVISKNDVDPATIDYKNATTILLKNVKISEIPKNYFSNLGLDPSLLRITNSRLRRIDEEAFDGLDHLNLLELSDNEITRLEPKTFTRLAGLELLQLKSNKIRNLFLVLENVQEIVLSHNEIEELQEGFLVGDSISFIDLRFNRLRNLTNPMKSLGKLTTIYISNNQITNIEPEVFADNKELLRVYASGNRLSSTDGLRLPRLMTLDLSFNQLKHLDSKSFSGMTFLDELLLQSNGITEVNRAFDETVNLKFLDMSDNQITEIDTSLFKNNPQLSKLRLSKNRIQSLKPFANNLYQLRLLDLSQNQIQTIDPEFFKQIVSLEILDLSFNKLTKIGLLLAPSTALVSLDLSSNNLSLDKDSLKFNKQLSQLNVSSNGLDMGLSYLSDNGRLTHLDLSNNSITNLCDSEPQLNSLTNIDISRNHINQLNCFKNSNWLPFSHVNIRKNPFKCDSDFEDVIAHFVLMRIMPNKMMSYTNKNIQSATDSLKTGLDMWNSVKRELCPDGLDIHITMIPEHQEDPQDADYDEHYWDHDYYDAYPSTESAETADGTGEKMEVDIEVNIKESESPVAEEGIKLAQPSEKESWVRIGQLENIVEEYDEDLNSNMSKSRFNLFTISLIFIGISLSLVLANVAIFVFIRMKGWKKDFRGLQKYTHLDNKVYKDTTAPNDFSTAKKLEENYRMNCAKIFHSFGFKPREDDTESVRKMIVDSGMKVEV